MVGEGFEPPKLTHMILSHTPLTRLGYPTASPSVGLEPTTSRYL